MTDSRHSISGVDRSDPKQDPSLVLVALDVDGTLVDAGSNLHEGLVELFQDFKQQVQFMLLTGRSVLGARHITTEIDLDCPLVCLNGSAVYDSCDSPSSVISPIPERYLLELLDVLGDSPGGISAVFAYSDLDWFAFGSPEARIDEERITNTSAKEVVSLRELPTQRLLKIVVVGTTARSAESKAVDLRERFGTGLQFQMSRPHYIEVNAEGVNKGSALQRLIGQKSERPYMIAVGDGENDLSTFAIVDKSYAVPWAHANVLNQATAVLTLPFSDALRSAITEAMRVQTNRKEN